MSVARASDQLVGRTFGEFVLRERIGEGGFGAVYRAEQATLDREAVVKVLHDRLKATRVVAERFLREAKLASKLDHPYAAHVYAFGAEANGELWIAMELVRGTPLDKILRIQGPLPLERFVPLLDRICEVVATAHEQGIVHRDLKPANVMVLSRAGRLLPKLLDFGIAKGLARTDPSTADTQPQQGEPTTVALATTAGVELTQAGAVMGSPMYMAPEQWVHAGEVDARTDIYSIGVLAYEVLTGKPPFSGKTLTAIATAHASQPPPPLGNGLPQALDRVIAKALAKEASDRYPDILSFAAAFRAAAGIGSEKVSLPALDPDRREAYVTSAPHPIAEGVAALEAARNPHQARDAMFQLVRTLLRYCGLLALACRSRVADRAEPPEIAETLRALHRGSLTDLEWFELTRALTRQWIERKDAYPLPELVDAFHDERSSIVADVTRMFALREMGQAAATDDVLIGMLEQGAVAMSALLGRLEFLAQYPLVVSAAKGVAERWMGVRRAQRTTVAVHGRELSPGMPALLDPEGVPILTLAPLFQVAAPAPGSPLELFLFEGRGRHGAKLVALPLGFEHHDDTLWDWFRAQLSGSLDDNISARGDEVPPYRGLSAFSAADSAMFVGREKLVDAFINRLQIQPLLAVVGKSGAGKSSFINAGVVPALPPDWRTVTMRPGSSPLAVLEARLHQLKIDFTAARVVEDRNALGNALRADAVSRGPLLLVVDQLEELFTLCQDVDERRVFADAIAAAARAAEDPIRIVFTLRDDFLVRAEQVPALRNRIAQALQLLTVPVADDLLRILIEPARRSGYEFEDPQLPQEMVRELADQPGALALLSFTAAKLWDLRDRHFKQLTRKAYKSLGGVGGALARHAEQTLAEMLPEEQRLTRETFRHLVTSQNTRAVLARSDLRQLLGADRHAEAVIEKLVAARLLVATENETGAETIEIVHEALLAAWPRLVEWHLEDVEGARFREQLRAAAAQWDERRRPKGLLWRGDALADYTRWRARHAGPLTDVEQAFTDASKTDAQRGRRFRTGVIATIMTMLAGGVLVLTTLNAREKEARRTANEARSRAEAGERQALEEHGRQLLLDGDAIRAAIYLDAAREAGGNSSALRYMLDRSLGILQKRRFGLAGLKGSLEVGLYTHDGTRIFVAGEGGLVRSFDARDGRALVAFGGLTETIMSASISPDDSLIAVGTIDGRVRIWNTRSGVLAHQFDGLGGAVFGVRFSADGKQLVAAAPTRTGGAVRIWNVDTGSVIAQLEDRAEHVVDAVLGPGQRTAYTISSERTLVRWNVATGAREAVLDDKPELVRRIVATADGKLVATGSGHAIKLWNGETGALVRTLPLRDVFVEGPGVGHRAIVPAFSPDGARIAVIDGRDAFVWDVTTGAQLAHLTGGRADLSSIAFSPDGARIATGSSDGTSRIWDAGSGQPLSAIPGAQEVYWVNFAADGKTLLVGGPSGFAEVWSTEKELGLREYRGLGEAGYWPAIRPHGAGFGICGENGAVRVWNRETADPVLSGQHAMCAITFVPAGTHAVTGGADGRIRAWDLATGKSTEVAAVEKSTIQSIAATDELIVAGLDGGKIRIWNRADGTIAREVAATKEQFSIAVSTRGIASCGLDAQVHVWSATEARSMFDRSLDGFCGTVAFSPNARLLASVSNKHAQVWQLDDHDMTLRATLEGHTGRLTAVGFTADDLLVTSSEDGTVRTWDADGRQLDALTFGASVSALDANRELIAASSGTTVFMWPPPPHVADDVRRAIIGQLPFVLKNQLLIPRAQ